METIYDPVSQINETTGVETIDDTYDNLQSDMDQQYGKRSYQYILRPRKKPKHYRITKNRRKRESKYPDVATNKRLTKSREYGHLHAFLHMQESRMDMYDTVVLQYRVKKGLELYKEDGFNSLVKEMNQLHTMKNVDPLDMENMTREQNQSAL